MMAKLRLKQQGRQHYAKIIKIMSSRRLTPPEIKQIDLTAPCQLLRVNATDYWKKAEAKWPELAQIVFDFMGIPAMSIECGRVFSSCAKITTAESSRLTGLIYIFTSQLFG
jgi:hypothetical protein